MKRQIRKNVFETNSSSTHSISIADLNDDGILDTSLNPAPGVDEVIIKSEGYGWEEEDYFDAENKAAYLIIYAHDWTGKGIKEDPIKKGKYLKMIYEVIREQTKVNKISLGFHLDRGYEYGPDGKPLKNVEGKLIPKPPVGDPDGPWAYIDHQSVECGQLDYLFEDKEKIRNFIFNKKSRLHTCNDNEPCFNCVGEEQWEEDIKYYEALKPEWNPDFGKEAADNMRAKRKEWEARHLKS